VEPAAFSGGRAISRMANYATPTGWPLAARTKSTNVHDIPDGKEIALPSMVFSFSKEISPNFMTMRISKVITLPFMLIRL